MAEVTADETAKLAAAAGLSLPSERLPIVAVALQEVLALAETLEELPLDGVEPVLARVEALNPQLNAYGIDGLNPHWGDCRNPHDPSRVPAGRAPGRPARSCLINAAIGLPATNAVTGNPRKDAIDATFVSADVASNPNTPLQ
jgi:hypothetical protein